MLVWDACVAWVAYTLLGELLVKNIEENKQEMLTSTREAVQAQTRNLQRQILPARAQMLRFLVESQCGLILVNR